MQAMQMGFTLKKNLVMQWPSEWMKVIQMPENLCLEYDFVWWSVPNLFVEIGHVGVILKYSFR